MFLKLYIISFLMDGGDANNKKLDLDIGVIKKIMIIFYYENAGIFKMPEKRPLSHYKIDANRNRLLMMWCNAEDMLLPRSNFTIYGKLLLLLLLLYLIKAIYNMVWNLKFWTDLI